MATVTLRICDHCDCRDNNDHPPKFNIKRIEISLTPSGCAGSGYTPDLCDSCTDNLNRMILSCITQAPKEGPRS